MGGMVMGLAEETMKVKLEELWPVMSEQLEAGGSVCFGPKGISMLPMLRQGIDSVVLKKAPKKLNKYDLPLYRRPDGHFVLHRVIGIKKDGYAMRGDNQIITEHGVQHDWVLAIVMGFYRGKEYVDIENSDYQRYCKARVKHQSRRAAIYNVKRLIKGAIRRIVR